MKTWQLALFVIIIISFGFGTMSFVIYMAGEEGRCFIQQCKKECLKKGGRYGKIVSIENDWVDCFCVGDVVQSHFGIPLELAKKECK